MCEVYFDEDGQATLIQESGETVFLDEAGGLISWVKRAIIGHDPALIGELEDELKEKIDSRAEQLQALQDIDKFIKEAKGITTSQVLFHLFGPNPGMLVTLFSAIIRNTKDNAEARTKYIEQLKVIREKIAAMKFK